MEKESVNEKEQRKQVDKNPRLYASRGGLFVFLNENALTHRNNMLLN